jgi:hypothetical protein
MDSFRVIFITFASLVQNVGWLFDSSDEQAKGVPKEDDGVKYSTIISQWIVGCG